MTITNMIHRELPSVDNPYFIKAYEFLIDTFRTNPLKEMFIGFHYNYITLKGRIKVTKKWVQKRGNFFLFFDNDNLKVEMMPSRWDEIGFKGRKVEVKGDGFGLCFTFEKPVKWMDEVAGKRRLGL